VSKHKLEPENKDLARPNGLDADGRKAHEIVIAYLRKHGLTHTGGCSTFYSPEAWAERGEEYGRSSKLIVVYDGGDVRRAFNMDSAYEVDCMIVEAWRHAGNSGNPPGYQPYALYEGLQAALHAAGFYFEECTGWYAAVYSERA